MFLSIRDLNYLLIESDYSCDLQASMKLLGTFISCAVLGGVGKREFAENKVDRQNARCSSESSMLYSAPDLASIEACVENPSRSSDNPCRFSFFDDVMSASLIDLTVFSFGK